MADEIRCPMCSKNNPAGTETCKFCGAHLSAHSISGSDEPDWLRDFRDTSAETGAGRALPWQSSNAPEPASDLPDWLSGGQEAAQESGLDFLSRLSGNEKSPETTGGFIHTPGPDIQPAQTDSSGGLSESNAAEEPTGEPSASVPGADLESWLAGLKEDQVAQQPAVEDALPASTNDELAAWLKSLGGEDTGNLFTEEPAQPPASIEWSEESVIDGQNQQTGVTGWLETMAHDAPPKTELTPESQERFQDWLSNDEVIRENQTPSAAPQEDAALPQDIPDWLNAAAAGSAVLGISSQLPEGKQPAENAPSPEGLPDWLSGFGEGKSGAISNEPPTVQPAPAAGDLPDWLSAPIDQPAAAEVSQLPSPDEGLPAWVSDGLHPAFPAGIEPVAPANELPDFAALFAEEKAGAEEQLSPEMFGESAEEPSVPVASASPVSEPPPATEPASPDWLQAFSAVGNEEPVSSGTTGQLPFVDEGLPAWLSSIETPAGPVSAPVDGAQALIDDTPEPQLESASDEPFQVDLPDWLSVVKPGQLEGESAGGDADEEALVPADLPNWVEDLRPLESIIPGAAVVAAAATADSGREEKLGPLAGMRGVLPGEELAVRFRKLPTYSARLRVSERQRSHAVMLQNILDMESIPKEVPAVPSQAPQYVYRLVIAVVLILALLAGMIITDMQIFPPPQPTASNTGLQNLYNQIESLPPDAPVLLAVEYEPGLSGEMQMAASSVIEHLMQRNVRMSIISTVPSGPILAEDLLDLVHPRKSDYNLETQVANLGYLPGGTTSLLEFALHPSIAAPLSFDGQPVWDTPPLEGVETIQDFILVLVLTDSAETGRAWVEQVQPLLGATPLSMVASAQAGPMLMPYHQSGQITGLLTGFIGGAMYEQRSGRVNLANIYWTSYQSGYLAGILMLIIGGIISAGLTATRKPRKTKV